MARAGSGQMARAGSGLLRAGSGLAPCVEDAGGGAGGEPRPPPPPPPLLRLAVAAGPSPRRALSTDESMTQARPPAPRVPWHRAESGCSNRSVEV